MTDTQRLQNFYIARLTTQERPCFVCSKFTSVVLTSADNSNQDWFYICRAHLGDFNFCSKIGGGSPKPKSPTTEAAKKEALANRPVESDSVSDLVSSIGFAWKSWRGTKKEEETDDKEKDKEDKKDEKKEDKEEETTPSPPLTPLSPTSSTTQQPIRFVVQRDYFYLRQREFMKKIQKKEANEKLKTLQFPEVPKTMPIKK